MARDHDEVGSYQDRMGFVQPNSRMLAATSATWASV
jgi:hypothetical protein